MDLLEKIVTFLGIGVIALLVFFAICAISAVITWWAWNTFAVAVLGLKTVTLVQAFALNLLGGVVRGYTSYNTKK